MKVVYDEKADTLTITFGEGPVAESDEDKPGLIIDYDVSGNVVGLEILDASERLSDPRTVEHSIVGEK